MQVQTRPRARGLGWGKFVTERPNGSVATAHLQEEQPSERTAGSLTRSSISEQDLANHSWPLPHPEHCVEMPGLQHLPKAIWETLGVLPSP
jgi:hypothetical protein